MRYLPDTNIVFGHTVEYFGRSEVGAWEPGKFLDFRSVSRPLAQIFRACPTGYKEVAACVVDQLGNIEIFPNIQPRIQGPAGRVLGFFSPYSVGHREPLPRSLLVDGRRWRHASEFFDRRRSQNPLFNTPVDGENSKRTRAFAKYPSTGRLETRIAVERVRFGLADSPIQSLETR